MYNKEQNTSFLFKKERPLIKIFTQNKFTIFLISWIVTIFTVSCRKMEGGQTVPAYIKIDSVFINTFYPSQGSSSSKITDVWVYVDDMQMGVFELPAKFPLLFAGKHKLEIRPGIKLNGISSTRVPYPFYKPIIFEDFEFFPDSVMDMGALNTEYYQNTKFVWIEDFESSVISIIETETSDTTIERTMPADNPEAFLTEHSRYSGKIVLTPEKPVFMAYSFNEYELPKDNSPVMLEMNFKTDHVLLIGVLVNNPADYSWDELLYLKETDEWNKIYINIGPVISRNPHALGFKIYFTSILDEGESGAEILLDNIKLICRIKK